MLGFFIVKNEQRKVRESIAVDMVNAVKNKDISVPRRVIESRESIVNFNKKSEKMAMIQFKPHEFTPSKTSVAGDTKYLKYFSGGSGLNHLTM